MGVKKNEKSGIFSGVLTWEIGWTVLSFTEKRKIWGGGSRLRKSVVCFDNTKCEMMDSKLKKEVGSQRMGLGQRKQKRPWKTSSYVWGLRPLDWPEKKDRRRRETMTRWTFGQQERGSTGEQEWETNKVGEKQSIGVQKTKRKCFKNE